ISRATASGSVYNLKSLDDFNGTYTAVGAGATVGGGGSVATMRNQNGVRITLRSTRQGVKFTLGASGVSLNIQQQQHGRWGGGGGRPRPIPPLPGSDGAEG